MALEVVTPILVDVSAARMMGIVLKLCCCQLRLKHKFFAVQMPSRQQPDRLLDNGESWHYFIFNRSSCALISRACTVKFMQVWWPFSVLRGSFAFCTVTFVQPLSKG